MSTRTIIVTIAIYVLWAALAVLAVQRLSAWVVGEADIEAQQAIALATGPWLFRETESRENRSTHARTRRATVQAAQRPAGAP